MKEQKDRHKNRVRNLVIALSLTAIILSVSTYAWFIGLQTVNVTNFDVTIATTDDLELSLNGEDWGGTVAINSDNFKTVSYEGNTNWWSGNGLIPMSSVGKIDSESSRMVLYEKASITTSLGGFRLMASRVKNGDASVEGQEDHKYDNNGYVAFDLFIKNHSGAAYFTDYEPLDEEAIYLSVDSAVVVNEAGTGVPNTGIENSVRVAFAQIGRVNAKTASASDITGITCATAAGVTGICTKSAQIWEPNDTDHVGGAISWYETSCKARTGLDLNDSDSFDGACGTVVDGTSYPTYAVNQVIGSSDRVDVYDGAAFNGYTTTAGEDDDNEKPLYAYPYFTDSMKLLTGTSRPTFMTLAPNSVTKVRVYIYIEGQDIDNYDFASIGKSILVNFGFTKQRYVQSDIPGYDGPAITSVTPTTQPTTTETP